MRKISITLILLLVLSLFSMVPVSAAAEVWVDSTGPVDATHFNTIQDGINAVDAGGTVHVAAGTYTLSTTINITKELSLLGAGAATTIIDGSNSVQCIYTQGLTSATTIDGFTIQNGSSVMGGGIFNQSSSPTITNCRISNNAATLDGGGMYNDTFSSPTLTGCTFSSNYSEYDGGGMYNNHYSDPSITGCTFDSNIALGDGGGMFNDYFCTPTINNCTFSNNLGNVYGGGMYNNYYSDPSITNSNFSNNIVNDDGGGMYNNYYSDPSITGCTFESNTAINDGGGMYNDFHSSPNLTNCDFVSNNANSGASGIHDGGGMHNTRYSSPTLTNCTFESNSADWGGGMHNFSYSSPTLSECTFKNNTANSGGGGGMNNTDNASPTLSECTFKNNTANSGGGIRNYNSSPDVEKCIFDGNTGVEGGGIYNFGSSPILTNCIFYSNTASLTGGGIYSHHESFLTLTNCTLSGNTAVTSGGGLQNQGTSDALITNCILWNNTPDEIYNQVLSTSTVTYSDILGGCPGTGNIDEDPLFVDACSHDYSLNEESPCIDAGKHTNSPAYGGVVDDIENLSRPQGHVYDMGAYEFEKDTNNWSGPVVIKPLVTVMLNKANEIWECLQYELPTEVPDGMQTLLEGIQDHMANASVLANPIYANGELSKAMALMKQLNNELSSECYPD